MQDSGRYLVSRRLGQGGMAEVLEGVSIGQSGFRRKVAIKRILREFTADPGFGRMFLDEAKIASQLHHANIVAVLDFGVSEGVPFQVLEFVDGVDASKLRDLGQRAGHPFPVELALAIATDVAHALEHAHAAVDDKGQSLGIVHRDVSPANVLVAWSGDVKLTDFGIAFAHGRNESTRAGAAKGTLLYMAPEQVLRGDIDGRTDLFGLGCALHVLITGKSPLSTENAMADLIAGGALALDPSLPEDVRAIIARATRLARNDRWRNATEMADALGSALAARVTRDARTIMREWLCRVMPQPEEAPSRRARSKGQGKRGKLDGFLDLELVLGSQEGGVREFNVRPSQEMEKLQFLTQDKNGEGLHLDRVQRGPAGTAGDGGYEVEIGDAGAGAGAGADGRAGAGGNGNGDGHEYGHGYGHGHGHGHGDEPDLPYAQTGPAAGMPTGFTAPDAEVPMPRRRRTHPATIVGGGLVLAVIGVFAVSRLSNGASEDLPKPTPTPLARPPTPTPTPAPAPAPALAPAPAPAPAPTLAPAPAPALAPAPAPPPAAAPSAPSPGHPAARPTPAAHVVSPSAPPAAPPGPAPAADGITSGILAIGGDGALKAEILVDGAHRGFAPHTLLLPLGQHQIVLVHRDGTRTTNTVTITANNTPSAPLHLTVP